MIRNSLISTVAVALSLSLGLLFTPGCESDAQTGAALGALAGAGIGQLAGRDTKSTLIGAGVGTGTGYLIGHQSDKKKSTQANPNAQTVTVNITNSNGSTTPVTLRIQAGGYVGPKGEYYNHLPTSEELKPIYGF